MAVRRTAAVFVLLAALVVAAGLMLVRDSSTPQNVPAVDDVRTEIAPVAESVAPVIEAAAAEPLPPAKGALAALPPDLIARRIAAGEELFTLHGEVLDAVTREPVPLFRMFCLTAESGLDEAAAPRHTVRIFGNPLGTFTFNGLERGRYNLLIRNEEYEPLSVANVEVPAAEEKITLLMSRGAWIDVTVSDFQEEGVSDLEVRLDPVSLDDPANPPQVRLRRTDDNGKAAFTCVPPGTYTLSLANSALAEQARQQFYLGPGASHAVSICVPALTSVLVSAKDAEGNALNLVQVRMWGADGRGIFRAETGTDGRARMEHVPSGEYTVKTYKPGFWRKNLKLTVIDGQEEVPLDIVLVGDPRATEAEQNPTPEQLERLKAGERPADVFGGGGG
ncbi:MAG: carboxypeptidase regulatory-like domain-containing protein [Planctomycetes bacterium]|nr:carboxypeptidase regulatory-like domain-containing protein [Planctomycetota bacterium]